MIHLANRLQSSPRHRHLFFFVLTLTAIAFVGYRFGTFDQIFHIPYLQAYANPSLYPSDPLIDLRWQNYSFFWHSLQPFYLLDLQMGLDKPYVLQTVMFLVHMLSVYLTFWAVWTLSQILFDNPLTSLIATSAFVISHLGQSNFIVIEFSLLNRTFVLPFVLFSLTLHLQKRTWLALGLLGLLFNLHVITALFGLAIILCDFLFNLRAAWRQTLLGLLIFVLLALPVLLWKANGPHLDFRVRQDWLDLVINAILPHLYRYWGVPYANVATLGGIGALGMYVLARRYAPSSIHPRSQDAFFLAPVSLILVHSILTYLYPITFVMQLQLMRAGTFIVILAYISFSNYLAKCYEAHNADWISLCGTTLLSPTPLLVPLVWGLRRWLPAWRIRPILTAATALVGVVAMIAYLYPYRAFLPFGLNIYPGKTDWYQAQRWAHDHTPTDALFITPPQIWSFVDPDWRVSSERGTVVTLVDMLEVALIPDYLTTWQTRFEALAPGAMEQFQGDYFQNSVITAEAFYNLSSEQLEKVASAYGASYLLIEKPNTRPFYLCYENSEYAIYAFNLAAAEQSGCSTE